MKINNNYSKKMDISKKNVNNTPRLLRIHPSQEGTNNKNKHHRMKSGCSSQEGNKKFN